MIKQGGIYLINFNPSKGTEAGKVRPALVIQTDLLNQLDHPSTMVMPLTTQLSSLGNVLRFHISSREQLLQNSDAMIDQIRAIDNRRFCSDAIAQLTHDEWQHIKQMLCRLF
jgi:mRNA interferase MazF